MSLQALEARISTLETKFNNVIDKQEDDVTNNEGAMTTGYDAFKSDYPVEYTVTNLRTWGIKFEDKQGNGIFLGRAGGSDEAASAFGVTAQMTELETNSDVTIVAV